MAIEGLSISDLDESATGALWVMNNTRNSKAARKMPGTVYVGIPDVAGRTNDGLEIPSTWLPINVDEMIPRQELLKSRQFRRAINDGLIKIISPEDAQHLLRQDGAYEERERLDRLKDIVTEATKQRGIKAEMSVVGGDKEDDEDEGAVEMFGEESLAQATKRGIEADEDGLQPSFKMQADRWVEESDMSVLNAMRARGKFTPAELRYMRAVLKKDLHVTTLARIEAGLKKK